jgi:hypothetical protein
VGVIAALASLWPGEAAAQVRWDLGVEGGPERRVHTGKPAGGPDSGFGPAVEAQAHVALFPLLRLGPYVQYDTSPVSGLGVRGIFSAGLDARVLMPWPRGAIRAYVRAAVGEAATLEFDGRGAPGGHFTEVPLAIGAAARVAPWTWVTSEVGARPGFAFGGAAYHPPSARSPSGNDTLAVYLTLGLLVGR